MSTSIPRSPAAVYEEAARAKMEGNRGREPTVSNIHQTIAGRKRFYKVVDVAPVTEEELKSSITHHFSKRMGYIKSSPQEEKNQFKITLDGRALKTPARNPLHLPNKELAIAIAAEWDAQTDLRKGIQPATMPLMTLASTAIDQALLDPDFIRNTCRSYLPTDSALFFTTEEDRILLKKQRQYLLPIIRWFKREFDLELQSKTTVYGRISHPEETKQKIDWMISTLDHFSLTCLQSATMECKSILLAFAFICRHLTLEQVKAISRLEEEFQVEVWGVVEGGHDMDRLNNSVSLGAVGSWTGLYWDQETLNRHMDLWRTGRTERNEL